MGVKLKSLSRRDFLKLGGVGAATVAALWGCSPGVKKIETAAWQSASPEEKRGMAEYFVKNWISSVSTRMDKLKLDPQADKKDRDFIESEFTDINFRTAQTLPTLDLSLPDAEIIQSPYVGGAGQRDSFNGPIEFHIKPNLIVDNGSGKGESDLVMIEAGEREWLKANAGIVRFQDLVEATLKLDDPTVTDIPLRKKNPWSGEDEGPTQWQLWLDEINSKKTAFEVPAAPIDESAVATWNELRGLFPDVPLPTPDYPPIVSARYTSNSAFTIHLGSKVIYKNDGGYDVDPATTSFQTRDGGPNERFIEALGRAQDLMKKYFNGREFITTEAVRRVKEQPNDEWSWDKPMADLELNGPDYNAKIGRAVDGLEIIINEAGNSMIYTFFTPVRFQP